MIRLSPLPVAALLVLSGCAYHHFSVGDPDPTAEWKGANSLALGFGQVPRRTVAVDCPSDLIDEVRVRQSLFDSLVTVVTLGLVAPSRVEYVCHKEPTEEGDTDETTTTNATDG